MKYSFDGRIRYSETDQNGVLKTDAMVDYLQDVSMFQAQDLGIGMDYLIREHRAWIVSAWQIDILQMPSFGDFVRTTTWSYEFKMFYGLRNFTMTGPDGKLYIRANGVFIFFDTDRQKPVCVPDRDIRLYDPEPKLDMEYLPRKIGTFSDDAKTVHGEPVRIEQQHLDTNHHVNNGQYILLARECISPQRKTARLRAEYKKQAHLGDVLYPTVRERDQEVQVSLNGADGSAFAIVEFYFG